MRMSFLSRPCYSTALGPLPQLPIPVAAPPHPLYACNSGVMRHAGRKHMLIDIIRTVLNDPDSPLSTAELTELVISRIPPDQLQAALEESVPQVIMQQRNKESKLLLRDPDPLPQAGSRAPVSASVTAGGARFASSRSALLLEDRLSLVTITGRGNRTIRLGNAERPDIRHEIDSSRSKGTTLISRADIFDAMLHEMSESGVRRAADLSPASRRKYALQLKDLYD